jgi:hypothetical protein
VSEYQYVEKLFLDQLAGLAGHDGVAPDPADIGLEATPEMV